MQSKIRKLDEQFNVMENSDDKESMWVDINIKQLYIHFVCTVPNCISLTAEFKLCLHVMVTIVSSHEMGT